MARPTKTGLDYFSFDVDFFDNLKVRKIMRACGPASPSILTCLLCDIYHWKGYYILWDDDLPFDIADKLVGVSEGQVKEVISKALQVDFFDQEMHQAHGILTSFEIQKRYRSGTHKRSDVKIDDRFLIYSDENMVIDGKNEVIDTGSTQSKVKESKAQKSKGNRAKALVVASDDDDRRRELKKKYANLLESVKGKAAMEVWPAIKNFVATEKPDWLEPYADLWNVFAPTVKLATLEALSPSRRAKFATRISESSFDFIRILEGIKKSAHLRGDNGQNWKCSFDWILENDKNYLKILEGNYA